jgi:hypothetical protein
MHDSPPAARGVFPASTWGVPHGTRGVSPGDDLVADFAATQDLLANGESRMKMKISSRSAIGSLILLPRGISALQSCH